MTQWMHAIDGVPGETDAIVTLARARDLNDIGARIGQFRPRSGHDAAEIQSLDMCEWTWH